MHTGPRSQNKIQWNKKNLLIKVKFDDENSSHWWVDQLVSRKEAAGKMRQSRASDCNVSQP